MNVKDFLGESNTLGIDIWEKKYRFENESFEEFLDRITGSNPDMKRLVLAKKFIYAGRILANRGLQDKGIKVTYSNCFTPDAEVLTEVGYKKITDVQVGDKVLTIDGTFQPVNHLLVSDFDGDLVVFESPSLKGTIKATPNHPMHTNDGWVNAEDVYAKFKSKSANLTLTSPLNLIHSGDETIDLATFLKPVWVDDRRELIVEDDKVYVKSTFVGGQGAVVGKISGVTKRYINVDSEVRYLLGRYIGDGSLTYRADTPSIFQIVFNAKNEIHAYNRIKKILEDGFGVDVTDNSNHKQGTLVLKVNNILFGQFILQMVGRNDNKHLPERYFGDISILLGLLDSDSVVVNGAVRLTMKNKSIVEQVQEWLSANNIVSHIKDIKQPLGFPATRLTTTKAQSAKLLPHMSKMYDDGRMNNTNTDISIYTMGREYYKGKVYNLSVENNHNYVVNGVLVHNCYVITPPEDSIESIYETDYKLARTYSMGGGCGVDISKLSPNGARVRNAAKTTSGVVSFMEQFSSTTLRIAQNGRRGALMLSIDCNHPDLEEFISVKGDLSKIVGANISIRIDDDFMNKVVNDLPHTLSFTRPETGQVIEKTVSAKQLFWRLAKMNWRTAEPGILFWDRIKSHTLLHKSKDFEFAGVNPCAR